MERLIVENKYVFDIGRQIDWQHEPTTWKDIQELDKTGKLLPTDVLVEFSCRKIEYLPGFGLGMDDIADLPHRYTNTLTIKRKEKETDKQFSFRMESEEKKKKYQDEQDRLMYLKLKAKFEPSGKED